MKTTITSLLFFSFSSLITSDLSAQDGSLDLSFGTGGLVTNTIGTFDDEAQAVRLQNDGKIVIAGHSFNGTNYDFMVARYNSNGSLDTTFGGSGIVTTAVNNGDDKAKCVAIQADGKILAAGYTYLGTTDMIAVVRYNTNGSIDSTFNGTGIAITSAGTNGDYANAIEVQSDGKIVVAGGSYFVANFQFITLRYNANGTPDSTFNSYGFVLDPVSVSGDDIANDLVIQSDGKIVVAGFTTVSSFTDFALIRYDVNGTPDPTFDTDGIVTHQVVAGNFNEQITGISLQADGKIVAVGMTNNLFFDFVVTRYNTNGSMDNTFDADGIVATDLGVSTDYGTPTDVLIQTDQKIIAAGYRNNGSDLNFALARYNVNGTLDSTFDSDGLVITDFPGTGNDQGLAATLQTDGKIIVAGGSFTAQNQIALARYNNSLSTDIITQDATSRKYTVSPNPFINCATIQMNGVQENVQVTVYSASGALVRSEYHSQTSAILIDRGTLPAGVYILQITINNNESYSDRIVICE